MDLTEKVLLHGTFRIKPSTTALNLIFALDRDKVYIVNIGNARPL